MNELHQKLAVLSSSLHSTSPQQMGESPHQYQMTSHTQQGSNVYSPVPQQQQIQTDTVSQMVVDSTTPFGQQQQQNSHLQQQQQHQMQTVVVNSMLQTVQNNSSSSGSSPLVLNVPVNNNISSISTGQQMSTASPALQQSSNFHPNQANSMPMHSVSANHNNNVNQLLLTQTPTVSVASHPSLVTTATPILINSPMTSVHQQSLPQQQQSSHQHHYLPHHHPINDLTSSSAHTTPSTTTIVTTNKLIEAVAHQGSAGPVLSVSMTAAIIGKKQKWWKDCWD